MMIKQGLSTIAAAATIASALEAGSPPHIQEPSDSSIKLCEAQMPTAEKSADRVSTHCPLRVVSDLLSRNTVNPKSVVQDIVRVCEEATPDLSHRGHALAEQVQQFTARHRDELDILDVFALRNATQGFSISQKTEKVSALLARDPEKLTDYFETLSVDQRALVAGWFNHPEFGAGNSIFMAEYASVAANRGDIHTMTKLLFGSHIGDAAFQWAEASWRLQHGDVGPDTNSHLTHTLRNFATSLSNWQRLENFPASAVSDLFVLAAEGTLAARVKHAGEERQRPGQLMASSIATLRKSSMYESFAELDWPIPLSKETICGKDALILWENSADKGANLTKGVL